VFGARPLVMGVVNTTPDSFSDGGDFLDPAAAIAHGLRLLGEGADILDVGGESSRPGHVVVGADEEIARVLPALRGLAAASDAPLSIDTTKPAVAEAALDAGATVVNDIWGLRREPRLARLAAERGAHVVVMHNRDEIDASIDIVADVIDTLRRSIDIALAAGVAEGRIIVDPGVGFGKTPGQNLLVTRELARLRVLGRPVLLGVSRKRMIGAATGRAEARDRLAGSLAAAVMGAERGAAIVRVHDVAAHVDAMRMYAAIRGAGEAT
jgi:dihydropteroate synthase